MFSWVTPFASAARTATPTAVEIPVPMEARVIEVVINSTAVGVTPSTVFNIDFLNADGTWDSVLASAAVIAVTVARLRVGDTIATAANVAAQMGLPAAVRIRPVHGNATTHTYSVGVWFRG